MHTGMHNTRTFASVCIAITICICVQTCTTSAYTTHAQTSRALFPRLLLIWRAAATLECNCDSVTHLTEVHVRVLPFLTACSELPRVLPSALPCCFSFFLSHHLPEFSKQRSVIIGAGNPTVNGG